MEYHLVTTRNIIDKTLFYSEKIFSFICLFVCLSVLKCMTFEIRVFFLKKEWIVYMLKQQQKRVSQRVDNINHNSYFR